MKVVVWRCHCIFCTANPPTTYTYPRSVVWWEDGKWWVQPHRVALQCETLDNAKDWIKKWAVSTTYIQVYK